MVEDSSDFDDFRTKRIVSAQPIFGQIFERTKRTKRFRKIWKKRSLLQMIDQVMTINSVQKSSKSELSSRFFGRLKICNFSIDMHGYTWMWFLFCFVLRTGITKKNQHFCKLMCLSYRRRQKRRQGVKLYHVTPARDNTLNWIAQPWRWFKLNRSKVWLETCG